MSVRTTQTHKRPMVNVNIKNNNFKMLYDTGSCITCMSYKVFNQLKELGVRMIKVATPSKEFTSANGGKLKSIGRYKIPMTIENKKVDITFHVLPKLHEDFILGIDFIHEQQLNLCLKHKRFHWKEGCPLEHHRKIYAQEDFTLPPQSTRICRIHVQDSDKDEKFTNYLAEVHLPNRPWVQGAPTIVTQGREGNPVLIELHNASLVPRLIQKNEVLGNAEAVLPTNILALNELRTPNKGSGVKNAKMSEFIRKNAKIEGSDTEKAKYFSLFDKYPEVFSKDKNDLGRCDLLQHEIHLKTKEPVYIKQFKIPEGHQQAVNEQVKEWLKLGIIQSSRSRYNSPIFVVKKKDGSFRLVQDFRALNQQTYIDKYSMRDVTECIHEIGRSESTIFSTIDLTSGFWQMVLEPKSRPLTAFTVYGMGQFEFKTSPMGLLGCPASFQRLMEQVTKGIPNVIVYIDDILVHSKTHDEHRRILDLLFKRLQQHHLQIRLEKCHFGKTEVEYLGFRLTPKGVVPGTDKVKAVRDTPPPASVHQVRQFLGLCNFFRNHIKQFALRSHPLTQLTRKDTDWKGGKLPPAALKSFQELKNCLTSQPIVSFPKRHLQYALITDAATGDENNPGGMGAILTQVDKQGKFYVIAYASKKLEKHEKNYTPFLLEMYAAVWGMEHFAHHLKGKRFLLFTDHKPLEKLGKVHTKTLYRIQEAMLHFDFEIHYKKGTEMPADYLSRNVLAISEELEHLQTEQINDPQLSIIIDYLRTGKIPTSIEGRKLITRYGNRCFMESDLLWIRFFDEQIGHRSLICVPKSLVAQICTKYHGSWYGGHGGINKVKQRLLTRYFWPNMDKDISDVISKCHKCQVRNKDNNPKAPLKPLPTLSLPNQRIHADLFGPLRTSESGKKFILVVTDAFTKYVELVATENKEASTISEAIFNNWICRFGIPAELVTDQGKEFTASVCQELWKKLDIIHSTTSPTHPQCNSQAEVVNKTIAKYLAAFVNENTLDWEPYLSPLMFSYNTSFHRSIKTSPFFLTYGVEPNLPDDIGVQYNDNSTVDIMSRLQLARHLAKKNIEESMEKAKQQYDKKVKTYIFQPNQQVLLDEHYFLNKNQKIAPKYSGPHLITKLKGNCNVELLLNNGKYAIVHVNRLKPYYSQEGNGQKFSKAGRGDNDDINRSKFQRIVHEENYNYEQEQEQGQQHQQNPDQLGQQPDSPKYVTPRASPRASPQESPQKSSPSRYLTRRVAQQQGLVYNKEDFTFQPQSSLDPESESSEFEETRSDFDIEALRARKRLIRKKIKESENYIVVEHVYQLQQVQPFIKIERSSISETDDSNGPPPYCPFSPSRLDPTKEQDRGAPVITRPPQTPIKTVTFNPEVQKQEFHTPTEPPSPSKVKTNEGFAEFAKEVIKSTAETIFPQSRGLPRTPTKPPEGPIKTFYELFPDQQPREKKEEIDLKWDDPPKPPRPPDPGQGTS